MLESADEEGIWRGGGEVGWGMLKRGCESVTVVVHHKADTCGWSCDLYYPQRACGSQRLNASQRYAAICRGSRGAASLDEIQITGC